MSKLVDLQRLAKLAQMLDARMKAGDAAEAAKIAQEILDRKAAVEGIQDQLDALAGNGEGSVVEQIANALQAAKDYADGKDTADKAAQLEKDNAQDKALEDAVDAIEKAMGEEATRVNEKIAADIKTATDAQKVVNDDFEERIAANEDFVEAHDHSVMEGKIAALEELHKENGVVDQKIKAVQDEVDAVEGRMDTAEGEIDALQQFVQGHDHSVMEQGIADNLAAINILKGGEDQAGSVAAAVKAEADRAKEVEEDHEDRIAANEAFVAAQPAIDAEQDRRLGVIEASMGEGGALESRVAANEAKLAGLEKDTVQAAIDQAEADAKAHAEQKIAELVDSAPDAMNTLNELAEAISANKGVYDAYVEQHATAMATMKTDLQKEIDDDVAAEAGLREAADNALSARLDVIEGEEDVEGSVKKALADAKAYANGLTDGVKETVGNIEEAIVTINDELARIEKECDDAMAQEVIDRNAAIKVADDRAKVEEGKIREEFAAVDTAIRQEMADEAARVNQKIADDIAAESALRQAAEQKVADDAKQMLADVVSSLNLEMVENKLKLSLGKDNAPIEIAEVSLDMATDEDIEAIFNNIDNPQA